MKRILGEHGYFGDAALKSKSPKLREKRSHSPVDFEMESSNQGLEETSDYYSQITSEFKMIESSISSCDRCSRHVESLNVIFTGFIL